MKVQQTGIFARRVKRIHCSEKKALDKAVNKVVGSPSIGKMKTGDLSGVQVYKYKVGNQQYLLAYKLSKDEKQLMLIALGTHENFYRDLKRHKNN